MRFWLLIGVAGVLFGQGTDTKPKPEDYEVHAQAKGAVIGAEFMVHSFSRGEASYLAPNYLVVEVALFPPKGSTLTVQNGNFSLRVNGKKELLFPQPASMVAAGLKHPEWEMPGGAQPSGSVSRGNRGVILGGPVYNPSPFPGSNPPGTTLPPRVEIPKDNPSGVEKEEVKPEELVVQTALVEGEHHAPISGFLYFAYRGKISGIKTLELLYEDAVLKLR